MSLLFSDSLQGILDEKSLIDDYESLGKIRINSFEYEIDAFIFDKRAIRVHAIAEPGQAIKLINCCSDSDAVVDLGENVTSITGKIHQIGWEQTLNGGRLVVGVIIRDK